jgi:hypothetical protein
MFGLMTTEVKPVAVALRRMLSSQRDGKKRSGSINLVGQKRIENVIGWRRLEVVKWGYACRE